MVKRNYGFPDEWASTFLLLLRARTASLQYRFCRLFFVHSSALRVLTLPFLGITIKIVTHLGYRQQRVFSLKSPRRTITLALNVVRFLISLYSLFAPSPPISPRLDFSSLRTLLVSLIDPP